MKNSHRNIYAALAICLLPAFSSFAQGGTFGRFAIKAYADLGVRSVSSIDCSLGDVSKKTGANEFGLDFGWTFWKHGRNSLEANIGVGYGRSLLTAHLRDMKYDYSAPATADMDLVPYIRYYELSDIHQKMITDRVVLPIYLKYSFQTSRLFRLNASVGIKEGFNVSSRIVNGRAKAFSYGVYPVYDDLMIDASYMNEFGESTISTSHTNSPETCKVTSSFLAGIGAELRLCDCQPVSVGIDVRYEGALTNMYKASWPSASAMDMDNALVTYTVADGQRMKPVSDYLGKSKLSRVSCMLYVSYHF